MQALMVVPGLRTLLPLGSPQQVLTQEVAGIPLLARVVATALRAGVTDLVLIWPAELEIAIWDECCASPALSGMSRPEICPSPFDPRKNLSWEALAPALMNEFLWLPWNFITDSDTLAAVERSRVLPLSWERPVLITKPGFGRSLRPGVTSTPPVEGVSVQSSTDITKAECFLAGKTGNPMDGIRSHLNQIFCRPAVRALVRTPITPRVVACTGTFIAIVSAVMYSRGSYWGYVAGAMLFFASGLMDEMAVMMARLQFIENAFETWAEGFADVITRLLVFSGMTVGLYRQRGRGELVLGIALIAELALSSMVKALHRRAPTPDYVLHQYSVRTNQLGHTAIMGSEPSRR